MKIITILVSASLLSFSATAYSVEIIPLLGIRGGGEFIDQSTKTKHTLEATESLGLILSFPYERGKTIEVYYSHQSTQLNSITIEPSISSNKVNIPVTLDYLHIGGTAPISEYNKLKTFVSGGFGFTYTSPDYPDTQSDLRASFTLGIGLKWPLTEKISLRLETRGLATTYNNNSAIFCNGGCTITVNGNLLIQAEVFAGVGIKF